MDMTPLMHAGVAAMMQVAMGGMTGGLVIVGVAGCTWFIAREHTQAEYRWIAEFGNGKRSSMPWWGGFDKEAWDAASVLDWLVPVAASVVVYLLAA